MKPLIVVTVATWLLLTSGALAQDSQKGSTRTNWTNLDCAKAVEHDEADLCEQRRMAKAAEEAVQLSWWQLIVGTCGFGFVVWNLWYVRRSTKAAIEAANAAERAVNQASVTAERQLRAYTSIELDTSKTPVLESDRIEISFKVTNKGQTPAYQFIQWNRMEIRDYPFAGQLRRAKDPKLVHSKMDILPNTQVGVTAKWRGELTADMAKELLAGRKRFFLYGTMYYRDAFKKRRYSRYCYTVPISERGTFSAPEIYYRGNESN